MINLKFFAAVVFLLAGVVPAAAQQAPEIGIYVQHGAKAKRLVGTGGKLIAEDGSFPRFLEKIGGTAQDTPPRNAAEEQWNAAVLNVLARQGWTLLGCEYAHRYDDYLYICHLQRDREEQPERRAPLPGTSR